LYKQLSVKITIDINDAILSTGSGCLFNPVGKEYMYVLTAKHCIIGKNGEFRDTISKENIKIQRQEHVNQKQYLEVYNYFLYPNDDHDLAVILIKTIDGVPVIDAGIVEENLTGKFYGFPSPMPNGVGLDFKITDKLLNKETEKFQIKTDDNLDTYLNAASINCQGFSGSGIYIIIDGKVTLVGIITELASKEAAFSRLNAESIKKFNTILEREELSSIVVALPKSPIQTQMDNYLPQFNSRLARIKQEDYNNLVKKSMKEVYDALIDLDEIELKGFLSKYYYPRVGHPSDLNMEQGIGELWELVTYINCNSEKWKLVNYDISNLEITYNENKELVNLIYSLGKFSIPVITLELGLELASSPYKKIIFDNLWIVDNFHNIYDDENICLNCGNGENYPFDNLLRDFSELNETGLLKGIEPKNNTFEELGNIKIVCANCIRKISAGLFIKNSQIVDMERANK